MTLSTRLTPDLEARLAKAVKGTGVKPSDIAREGVARVLAEYETAGSVRFGITASRRKPAPRRRKETV